MPNMDQLYELVQGLQLIAKTDPKQILMIRPSQP